MSGAIRATPAELRSVATGVKAKHAELAGRFNALNTDLSAFEEYFQGGAAAAFGTTLGQWYTAVGGMTLTLESLATYLDSVATTFEGVDVSLADAVGSGSGGGSGAEPGPRGGGSGPGPVPPHGPGTPPVVGIPSVPLPIPEGPPKPGGPPIGIDDPPIVIDDPADKAMAERLERLRLRHDQVINRLSLVDRRIEWQNQDLDGLVAERARLLEARAALEASGGDPKELALVDAQLTENGDSTETVGASIARLGERQSHLGARLEELRLRHDQLAETIGAPPLVDGPPHLYVDDWHNPDISRLAVMPPSVRNPA